MDQNKTLRDVDSTAKWLTKAVKGAGMDHIWAMVQTMTDFADQEKAGFIVRADQAKRILAVESEVVRDDEWMADLAGRFMLSLVTHRCRRLLPLLAAWPSKMLKVRAPEKCQNRNLRFCCCQVGFYAF